MTNHSHPHPSGHLHGPSNGPPRIAGPAQPQQQFDPWIIWVTFRRCWHWALPVGAVLAGLAAFVVVQTFEPRFEASAMLEANDDFILQKIFMASGDDDLATTEKPLLFNRIVLDDVLDDPALRSAPSLADPETAEANLRENLIVKSAGSSKRMSLSYIDADRKAAADVCNAVASSYLRVREEFDNARVNNLERWLAPEIDRLEEDVENRKRIIQTLNKSIVGKTPGQVAAVGDEEGTPDLLTDLRRQIMDLEVEVRLGDAVEKMRSEQLNDHASQEVSIPEFIAPHIPAERISPTESQIDMLVDEDRDVQEAMRMIEYYKQEVLSIESGGLERLSREYLLDSKAKIEQWKAKLALLKKAARPRIEERLIELAEEDFERRTREAELMIANARAQHEATYQQRLQEEKLEIRSDISQQSFQRNTTRKKLELLQAKYDAERKRAEAMGGETVDLQFAKDDLAVANGILEQLRNRVFAIRTERSKGGAVRILAKAKLPRTPIEAVPIKKIIGASGAAFMIPFLLGLFWEFRVQRVTDSSTVERSATLAPLVGEVARLPSGTAPGKGRRLFEESIETLRANLFLSVHTRDTRTIAVASSMSGEGKSSVASQLAISMAKASGETVLLVDADLRCPDQHEIFGLEMGPGLCGVLSGESTLANAVNTSLGDLVHVLPAGQLNTSPHRLMSPSSMRNFFDEAMKTYTYVVVDTAPVLAAGETLAVSSAVDATLLCVMRDVSRMDSVNKTTQRLNAAGANVAGTVFSGVAASKYAYRYGDYEYALPSDV